MDIRKTYAIELGTPAVYSLVLAGCGGTGSFLALHLARLAYHARETRGLDVQVTLVDPDHVEPGNLGRQNFCPAELGRPKALALMARYNRAFGLAWSAFVGRFDPEMAPHRGCFNLVIGCVDNAAARVDLQRAVGRSGGSQWWLDCGNHEHAGQVLLGNRVDLKTPEISPLGFCAGLPAPSIQHPELLQPPPILEVDAPAPGCTELLAAGAQSLMINQAIAGLAAAYIARLILGRLDIYASYIDLATGSMRSLPITGGAGEGG